MQGWWQRHCFSRPLTISLAPFAQRKNSERLAESFVFIKCVWVGLQYFFDALWSDRFEQPNVPLRCECCEKRSEMIESHYRVSHTNEGLLAGNAKRAVSH